MPAGISSVTLRSISPAMTQTVAATVARHLAAGDLVALTGELGAGKTCFVQGAARELGVVERVLSPSFLLRRDYEGRIGVTHLDVYRLETLSEVSDLGHDDPGQQQRVTFVEWGDAIRPLLPSDHLEIEFRLPPIPASTAPASTAPASTAPASTAPSANGEVEPRTLILRAHGPDWLGRIEAVAADCTAWVVDGQEPTS